MKPILNFKLMKIIKQCSTEFYNYKNHNTNILCRKYTNEFWAILLSYRFGDNRDWVVDGNFNASNKPVNTE